MKNGNVIHDMLKFYEMDDLIETVLNMKLLWLREMIEKDT